MSLATIEGEGGRTDTTPTSTAGDFTVAGSAGAGNSSLASTMASGAASSGSPGAGAAEVGSGAGTGAGGRVGDTGWERTCCGVGSATDSDSAAGGGGDPGGATCGGDGAAGEATRTPPGSGIISTGDNTRGLVTGDCTAEGGPDGAAGAASERGGDREVPAGAPPPNNTFTTPSFFHWLPTSNLISASGTRTSANGCDAAPISVSSLMRYTSAGLVTLISPALHTDSTTFAARACSLGSVLGSCITISPGGNDAVTGAPAG